MLFSSSWFATDLLNSRPPSRWVARHLPLTPRTECGSTAVRCQAASASDRAEQRRGGPSGPLPSAGTNQRSSLSVRCSQNCSGEVRMKRHGRSHVLEREPAAGGHIIRARLMRGGRARTGRSRPRQPARIASYDVARSAHGGRSGGSSAHNEAGDLPDDRTPAIARRDPCPPASAPARRRFARLAEPEARAIA
jgi:hypothetical protein